MLFFYYYISYCRKVSIRNVECLYVEVIFSFIVKCIERKLFAQGKCKLIMVVIIFLILYQRILHCVDESNLLFNNKKRGIRKYVTTKINR